MKGPIAKCNLDSLTPSLSTPESLTHDAIPFPRADPRAPLLKGDLLLFRQFLTVDI